jgi:hypothetical protein
MWFDSMDAVKAFAGERANMAVVPPAARALLKGCDDMAAHYEVRETREA